jgi:hypothetical protein
MNMKDRAKGRTKEVAREERYEGDVRLRSRGESTFYGLFSIPLRLKVAL